MAASFVSTSNLMPGALPLAALPVSHNHHSRSIQSIVCAGGEISSVDFWIHFLVGTPDPGLERPSYMEAGRQWKILLNPRRDHFVSVLKRSIAALRRANISVQGKSLADDVRRNSTLLALDDPCEPKILFYVVGSTLEQAETRFVHAMTVLESEFLSVETDALGCPEGYRTHTHRQVSQWGPSFTKKRNALIFYQQGGYIESERKEILESAHDSEESIWREMSQYFSGENFYLHKGTIDPLENTHSSTISSEQTTQKLVSIFSELQHTFLLTKDEASIDPTIEAIRSFGGELLISHDSLSRVEFLKLITLRYACTKKVRAIRKTIKKNPITPQRQKLLLTCQQLLKGHPSLAPISEIHSFLRDKNAPSLKKHLYSFAINGAIASLKRDFLMKSFSRGSENIKTSWKNLRDKIFGLIQECQQIEAEFPLVTKDLQWLSGSSSASLPLIFQNPINSVPSLTPTGMLVQKNVPPFCGELDRGISFRGINITHLSGTNISHRNVALRYANQTSPIDPDHEIEILYCFSDFAAEKLTRAKIAALRLTLMGERKDEYKTIVAHFRRLLNFLPPPLPKKPGWQQFLPLLGKALPEELFSAQESPPAAQEIMQNECPDIAPGEDSIPSFVLDTDVPAHFLPDTLTPGDIVGAPVSDGTYVFSLVTDVDDEHALLFYKDTTEDRVPLQELLSLPNSFLHECLNVLPNLEDYSHLEQCAQNQMRPVQEKVEEIIHILETQEPLVLSTEERQFIQNPTPIVWGSLTAVPGRLDQEEHIERVLEGIQVLGQDIQVLFVPVEKIDEIRTYVTAQMPPGSHLYVLPKYLLEMKEPILRQRPQFKKPS